MAGTSLLLIQRQIEKIFKHKGEIFSLSQIKETFEIPQSTYIGDTWLWQHRFLEKVGFNQYKIIGFSLWGKE